MDRLQFTLYSGAHRGAESEFGKQAERWGIPEVNFSFEGHALERTRGVRVLGPSELDKGDVSMEIVSARMGRTYSKADKIRKVIQSIHLLEPELEISPTTAARRLRSCTLGLSARRKDDSKGITASGVAFI